MNYLIVFFVKYAIILGEKLYKILNLMLRMLLRGG